MLCVIVLELKLILGVFEFIWKKKILQTVRHSCHPRRCCNHRRQQYDDFEQRNIRLFFLFNDAQNHVMTVQLVNS